MGLSHKRGCPPKKKEKRVIAYWFSFAQIQGGKSGAVLIGKMASKPPVDPAPRPLWAASLIATRSEKGPEQWNPEAALVMAAASPDAKPRPGSFATVADGS